MLLGAKGGAKVSRYERGHRIPPLRTALAYAAILDVPVTMLFPDIEKEVQEEIAGRMREFSATLAAAQLKKRGSARAARMAQWVNEHHGAGKTNSFMQ